MEKEHIQIIDKNNAFIVIFQFNLHGLVLDIVQWLFKRWQTTTQIYKKITQLVL